MIVVAPIVFWDRKIADELKLPTLSNSSPRFFFLKCNQFYILQHRKFYRVTLVFGKSKIGVRKQSYSLHKIYKSHPLLAT